MSGPLCLHVAGWTSCSYYSRAASVVGSLSILFPKRLKVVNHAFQDRAAYRQWLIEDGFRDKVKDSRATNHASSPFVWFSSQATNEPDISDVTDFVGGHDDTMNWARTFASPQAEEKKTDVAVATMAEDGHTADHTYDYDLVVIGGGSGGMAAAKEATEQGAKVACLDFVKPSPAGTTWGLGGTCVNVGCIPKKLMHTGALLQESMVNDLEAFGIDLPDNGDEKEGDEEATSTVVWEKVRENIQNYIHSLNFKYRVALREKNVKYFNKVARFVDAHTIEATDKKGNKSTITASRFLVAVGGRPAALDCEGGELAISSDDVFSIKKNPGKTLCVGASYISLECAGFLAGYGNDVTVAVRSILLRGFDRECVDRIGAYMESHGVKFKRQVTPTKLEKIEESGQIKVSFSDGSSDTYDTVLAAVGRRADTDSLGLDAAGIKANPKNGKIYTTMEQSSTPNIYAVGDVMEGCPELTPVAIQAGQLLARRLFGKAKNSMDYVNICTTVFTPIEYACVGLSEEDSKKQCCSTEVYIREFLPLEWSMSSERANHNAFAKVIVDKSKKDQPVLGIHYVGPNAGEVMQGYGAAMKNGLTMATLRETVGIHPTSSEEIVSIAITKSSGEDAAAGGC